jgi:hypothetical protein
MLSNPAPIHLLIQRSTAGRTTQIPAHNPHTPAMVRPLVRERATREANPVATEFLVTVGVIGALLIIGLVTSVGH